MQSSLCFYLLHYILAAKTKFLYFGKTNREKENSVLIKNGSCMPENCSYHKIGKMLANSSYTAEPANGKLTLMVDAKQVFF